jgi:hypothetical protein
MTRTRLKIQDLKPGDRILFRWYRGQPLTAATVKHVVPNASRASGTTVLTDAGCYVRLKATCYFVYETAAAP